MSLSVVVGVGLVCFLMVYLMNSLDNEKHWVMKLLILFFVVSTMLLIPKASYDSTRQCDLVLANVTTAPATVETYAYRTECYTTTLQTTTTSFLQTTQLMYYLIIGYAIVTVAIWAMYKLMDSVKRRRG